MSLIEIIIGVASIVGALLGGAWGLLKLVGSQHEKRLDERFTAIEVARAEGRKQWDERLGKQEDAARAIERQLLELKAELPEKYIRREDYIRFETVIFARLDTLSAKLDLISEKQGRQ